MGGMRKFVLPLLCLLGAAALAYFAVQNVQTYRASNYPPDGAELVTVHVMTVETQQTCSNNGHCTTETDGVTFLAPGFDTQTAPAHADFSAGDEIQAFQDADGNWQVKGAFPKSWLERTVGLTGGGSLILLAIAGYLIVRGVRRGSEGTPPPASSAAPPS